MMNPLRIDDETIINLALFTSIKDKGDKLEIRILGENNPFVLKGEDAEALREWLDEDDDYFEDDEEES